jgi:hypothetical protein
MLLLLGYYIAVIVAFFLIFENIEEIRTNGSSAIIWVLSLLGLLLLPLYIYYNFFGVT